MTQPDENRDEPAKGTPDGQVEPEPPLDVEAAWRAIVENYGERPDLGEASKVDQSPVVAEPVVRDPFDRSYLDSVDATEPPERHETRAREEHFVPPEPPPLPRGTPARLLAWLGLFGAPVVMLAAVAFGIDLPMWVSVGMVAAFIGGFVFLVATMPRDGDGGRGDGAVV